MPKRSLSVFAAGLALLAAFAAASTSVHGGTHAHALTNCDTSEDGINAAEQQMLDLINQARAQAGVGALKLSATLNRAAAWKSADSGSNGLGPGFDHTDSLKRDAVQRGKDCGYPYGMAENISWGATSAQSAFNLFMSSPRHRANILMASYRVIGIGQHLSAWTTDFGTVDDSNAAAPASPTPTKTPTATPTATPVPRIISGISMPLSPGMNLVTYGGERQAVAAALSSLGDTVTAAYEWDPVTSRWEKYAPGCPAYVSSFTSFRPGGVYYIEVSAAGTWSY